MNIIFFVILNSLDIIAPFFMLNILINIILSFVENILLQYSHFSMLKLDISK